jgi:hypothetical protein
MRYEGWGEEPAMPGDAASFLERLAESG